MIRLILFLISLITCVSCKPEQPELNSVCPDYTRSELVSKERALVRLQKVNGQPTGNYVISPLSELYRSYVVSWIPCNLPTQYQRDTLSITVSGYKLVRPNSQATGTMATPFEITELQPGW